ncbi:response regulator [Deinococcus yavapaiensis]|uniref:Response regulator receiver domain-containing protein n=1 Tax=Deinococcus yavapaiensis KR-236 TaxID=694435 RepID=A0A318S5H5_9DEIO|nr:response regulator [Deinococcus yavapaiensis]PYE53805.1 response regulator receiver domain-containing protein [Deinococcus yavapaiensis KR-236]
MRSKSFTLLLVEDELADAALFQDMLAEVGGSMTVHHVEHGQAALDFLTRQGEHADAPRPDLVVLDLNMPVMNGHEFLAQVKQLERVRSIPVLVLSTSDRPEDVHRSYDAQASGYVVKPGTYQEYTRVLETVQAYWQGVLSLPSFADLQLDHRTPERDH